jgi:hypothetical protein
MPQRRVLPLMMLALQPQRREQAQNIARQSNNDQRLHIDRHGSLLHSDTRSKPRDLLQPASRKTKDYPALNDVSGVTELAMIVDNKRICPRLVRHVCYIRQLCQSRFHIARSTPLAHQPGDFDYGGLAVVADDVRLRIDPDVV